MDADEFSLPQMSATGAKEADGFLALELASSFPFRVTADKMVLLWMTKEQVRGTLTLGWMVSHTVPQWALIIIIIMIIIIIKIITLVIVIMIMMMMMMMMMMIITINNNNNKRAQRALERSPETKGF